MVNAGSGVIVLARILLSKIRYRRVAGKRISCAVRSLAIGLGLCGYLLFNCMAAYGESDRNAIPVCDKTESLDRNQETTEELSLYATSALLMDADSGRVLYEKNGREQRANASTTKIMTCILALEYGNPEDIVTFSTNAARQPDVQMNAGEGEQYYLKDLLYALMLESHNDVAVAIAEHIAGSVEQFADDMNEKAGEIGAYDTHFVTPNGLDAEEHYTTAYDLARIACYAIQNDAFLEIIQTPAHTFSEINGKRSVGVVNRDAFLTQYDGAIGIKTGFTGNAGYCFVGAARRNGITLVSVVLASGWPPHKTYKWSDTRALMEYGFQRYSLQTVLDDTYELPDVPVERGMEADTVSVRLEEGTKVNLLVREDESIRYELSLPEAVTAPVRQGDVAGTLDIYIDEDLFTSEVLYFAEDIPVITYAYYLKKIYRYYFLVES